MITLALYHKMLADNVANLADSGYFYWEEMPLQHDGEPARGVWLITRPGNIQNTRRGLNLRSTVDFFVALEDKVLIEQTLARIRDWITQNQWFCSLSGSDSDITYQFSNIRIRPTTTPQNSGVTENGLFVKVASAEIIYDDDLTNQRKD